MPHAHLRIIAGALNGAPRPDSPRRALRQGRHAVDPATAKILVSAALVASIALFSLVSIQAFIAQVASDLRAAKPVRVPARAEPRQPPQA